MRRDRSIIPVLTVLVALSMISVPFMVVGSSDDVDAVAPSYDFYYDALTAEGKVIYDGLLNYAKTEQTGDLVINIDSTPSDNVISQAMQAFLWEHPEYFWIDRLSTFSQIGDELTIKVELIEPVANATDKGLKIDLLQAEIEDEVEDYIVAGLPRYDIIKGFHNEIIDDCSYDSQAASNPSAYDSAFDITGVFIDESAVCQGYSYAMKYLCDIAGIPCINVSGNAYNEPGSTAESHMWNYIMMEDGKWYCLDVTWDDPIVIGGGEMLRYDFFLVGADTVIEGQKFIQSHVPDYDDFASIFSVVIPTVDSSNPEKVLSAQDYIIRPGSESGVNYLIGDAGEGNFTLTKSMIDPSDEESILYKIGSKGKGTIIAGDVKFTISYLGLSMIFSKMESTSTDKFVFGALKGEQTITDMFGKDYTKMGYAPFILNGTVPILDLEDIHDDFELTLSIPYEKTSKDIKMFLKAYSLDSDGDFDCINDSTYDDGFVTFTTDDMDEAYVVLGNPLGDFSLYWVFGVAGAIVLLALTLIGLFIRAIIKH